MGEGRVGVGLTALTGEARTAMTHNGEQLTAYPSGSKPGSKYPPVPLPSAGMP